MTSSLLTAQSANKRASSRPATAAQEPRQALSRLAVYVTAALLAALLALSVASVPGTRRDAPPAPAPAPGIAAGFPEQADPAGGCIALETRASALGAPRADAAAAITSALLMGACPGA